METGTVGNRFRWGLVLKATSINALTRVGFAARGLMYLVIAWLALRWGRAEDGSGALAYLSSGSAAPILIGMAAGFAAYGVWRLSNAIVDADGHGGGIKGAAARTAGAVSGLVHLSLGFLSLKLGFGRGQGSGSDASGTAADALSLPGGELLVIVVAAALIAMGAFQLLTAVKGLFLRHLSDDAARAQWVRWLGRLGYTARGVVFLLMGWFLWRAGIESDAGEAAGMGEALGSLPPSIRTVVAVGLLLFGGFSLVEARYRRIADPAVLKRVQSAVR